MKKEAKFILDKPKATTDTHIFLKFSCKDKPLKYSTQQKTHPEGWDSGLQRTKKNRQVNTELDRLYRIVEAYIESQRKLGYGAIYWTGLKDELDSLNSRPVNELTNTNNFFTACSILIKEAKDGTLLTVKSKKKYSQGTIGWWEKTVENFRKFDPGMKMDKITLESYKNFINWCNGRGYTINYTGGMIAAWKLFINHALAKKWHTNQIAKHEDFKRVQEESTQVYLNEKEINILYELDLSGCKYHEKIRDRYIINMYNGLRISDMKTLSIDNIQSGMITHVNQKTSKTVVIPVHYIVIDIIKKYNGVMPKQYKSDVVNREIKKIAKDAGIDEKIRFTKTVGGITKAFTKEKWEMVSNHTSRRSMATNLLKHVNMQEAMPVMGMSIRTLQLYNKISAKENAESLKSNPFFNK